MGKRDRLRKERIRAGLEAPIASKKNHEEAPGDLSEVLRVLGQIGAMGQGLSASPKRRFQFATKKRK